MRVLDLCSGIGGFSLGLQRAGMETVAFCEIDEFCRKILNKHWPDVPVFKDIKALANGSEGLIPGCDIICGGVPCQPFSVAGKQEGQGDTNRHLWPYMFEIVKQQKPAFVIVENVAGFVNMALDDVLSDLESEGYASQSFVIPACAVDAKHRRDRVFIVGYAKYDGLFTSSLTGSHDETPGPSQTKRTEKAGESEGTGGRKDDVIVPDSNSHDGRRGRGSGTKSQGRKSRMEYRSRSSRLTERQPNEAMANTQHDGFSPPSERGSTEETVRQESKGSKHSLNTEGTGSLSSPRSDVANSYCEGLEIGQGFGGHTQSELSTIERSGCEERAVWPPEPRVGRVADGVPNRVDRIKGLGNAVVPQVVEVIGRAIMEFYEESQSKNQS